MAYIVAAVVVVAVCIGLFMIYRRRSRPVVSPAYDERRAADNCRPLASITVLPRDSKDRPLR